MKAGGKPHPERSALIILFHYLLFQFPWEGMSRGVMVFKTRGRITLFSGFVNGCGKL